MENRTQQDYSMKWFKFYLGPLLITLIILRGITTFASLGTYFELISTVFSGKVTVLGSLIALLTIVTDIVVVVMAIYIRMELDTFTPKIYKFNLVFIALLHFNVMFGTMLRGITGVVIVASIIAGVLWILPNYLYFSKRKSLFVGTSQPSLDHEGDSNTAQRPAMDASMREYADIMMPEKETSKRISTNKLTRLNIVLIISTLVLALSTSTLAIITYNIGKDVKAATASAEDYKDRYEKAKKARELRDEHNEEELYRLFDLYLNDPETFDFYVQQRVNTTNVEDVDSSEKEMFNWDYYENAAKEQEEKIKEVMENN